MPIRPLGPDLLSRRADPGRFSFDTTAALPEPAHPLGQERAEAAVRFGIDIRRHGYNLFVAGPSGMGKQAFVRRFLEPSARAESTPDDWCYVPDFKEPRRPRALRLPPGRGARFKAEVGRLLTELKATLPVAFETDEYRRRKRALEDESAVRTAQPFAEIESEAAQAGIAISKTPTGLAMAPLRDGAVVEPEKLKDLPAAEQEQFRADVARLEERVREATDAIPLETRRLQQVVRELDREVAAQTIGHLLEELRGAFLDLPAVLAYLDALKADVLDNLEELLSPGEEVRTLDTLLAGRGARRAFARYEVNLLVDNVTAHGAPVVYENHPTLPNLVGRVDAPSELGHPASDHRLVVAGALHRANGGYLIVDAHKLLPQPSAWEGLKRALRSREIRIESVGQALSLMGTASVEPEPIPLRVKVVLLGERSLYLALSDADPEFLELFKVAADLDDSVPRTGATEEGFAAHLGSLARREGLRPLDASAAARMIDHAARVTGDAERLSLDTDALLDLLGEADHLAGLSGRTTLDARHVQAAIEAQVRRADRLRDRMQEEIRRGTILIETRGTQVGQVNALAVYHVGRYGFGRPSRITARVRLGNGRVLDIEREVALGGAIHSKGVLILAGFLGGRYAADQPLSLSASLVFEQSYGGVDGDSASCAELIALLSAIGEVPVTQSVAVTGSINQKGQVQPVGGVNEKIEGFFDVCCARGQACEEGVMIPAANIKHLMLRQDVVEAVREGRFRIWAVETIDEAIEVMTGMAAGERADGSFPPESFNGRVESRLAAFAERARDFARAALEPGP